jgi:hypothetical protein
MGQSTIQEALKTFREAGIRSELACVLDVVNRCWRVLLDSLERISSVISSQSETEQPERSSADSGRSSSSSKRTPKVLELGEVSLP